VTIIPVKGAATKIDGSASFGIAGGASGSRSERAIELFTARDHKLVFCDL
jgi:hypothetical protein